MVYIYKQFLKSFAYVCYKLHYYNEAMYVHCLSDYVLPHEAICIYYFVNKMTPQNP